MTNKLLDRTVELIITARHSPARTTIIAENPADRSIVGTNQYSRDLEMHGSLFATSAFKKLQAAIPDSSMCTFAQCRFNNSMGVGHPYQKYTTLWYTNDAAHVLDQLNEPSFQCNHPEGTHEKKAGGRGADGRWESKASAAYPDGLNVRIAMALTFARTGSAKPMSTRPPEMSKARAPVTEKGGPAAQVDPVAQTEDGRAEAAKQRAAEEMNAAFDYVRIHRPDVVVGENVAAFGTGGEGQVWRSFLAILHSAGQYNWAWQVLQPVQTDTDAAINRSRFWYVGVFRRC